MELLKFIFPFLFVRNWHTGHLELSIPRVVLFVAMVGIVLIAVVLASILQAPISYEV